MNKTVLVVAFHFPPAAVSSGLQRALKTVRFLHEDGWQPIVLTASPRAYPKTHDGQLAEIPCGVPVKRVFSVDASRYFSIRGRYPDFLTWPDRWSNWFPGAAIAGQALIRQHRPSIIWSTFPISTTNLVASHLAVRNGLPWVADLRDPMTLDGYPPDKSRHRVVTKLEQRTVRLASRVVFTSEYTRRLYRERYPEHADRMKLIPNGYDEGNFPDIDEQPTRSDGKLRLLHSGSLQPKGRSPATLFQAIAALKSAGVASAENLSVVLRGTEFDAAYVGEIERFGVADVVSLEPYLPYERALAEMVNSDVLLLFQGEVFNHAIPAKLYEYLYARKPILAIVDKRGGTQSALEDMNVRESASIDSPKEIEACLRKLLDGGENAAGFLPDESAIPKYSRRQHTRTLAAMMERLLKERARSAVHEALK
ncbi:MAG: glycosyltransferase [Pseudomonadota bacterium]